MSKVLFKNAIIITMNKNREILYGGSLLTEGNRIINILSPDDDQSMMSADRVIDCEGKIILPGFVNTHTHLFQNLLKGMGDDMALDKWLATMTFPAARFLTPEHCYNAAMAGVLEGLNSGVTTNLDYMYPHNRGGLSEGVIKAFKDSGIRGIFGRGCMDTGEDFGVPREIMQSPSEIEKDVVQLMDKHHNSEDERIKIWLAPAAIWSSTEQNLSSLKALKETYKTGLTVHISETPFDRDASVKLHGIPDADMLERMGLTGPDLLMVHCVFLTERDKRMAAHYDMKVSHNTVSNMYLSSGVAPVPSMLAAGITVGLGVDGAASNNCQDMIELMKMTALLHKVDSRDPTIITAEKVLEMATIDGARSVGLEEEIGSLEPGKKADILVFNPFRSAKSIPMHNPVSTIVYSSSEKNIETVMVDGKILVDDGDYLDPNGKLTGEKILKNSQESAEDLAALGGMTNRMEGHPWRSSAF